MKKLMFTAVALMAGIAVADIQSSNIVGYDTVGINNGKSVRTATFCTVGEADFDVQGMIPKGDNVPKGDGTDIIYFQILTSQSKVKDNKSYYWLDWTKTRMGVTTTKYGWYEDAAGTTPANLKLKPGQAFYVTAPFADINFEFAGQVRVDSVVVDVNQGKTMIGNPYPVECSVTNIVPVAYSDGDSIPKGDGTDIIYFQELTAQSKVKDNKSYYWLDWTKTRMGVTTTKYGWYEDAAGTTPAKLTIQPGGGIYITSPVACQFTISGVMSDIK